MFKFKKYKPTNSVELLKTEDGKEKLKKMSIGVTTALARFNRMYEDVTNKTSSEVQYTIVRNYGRNMINLYDGFFCMFDEAKGKVKALDRAISMKIYEKEEG